MEKPAGSGKRFLIFGLGAVGAALILPACGPTDASSGGSSIDVVADGGTGGDGATVVGTGTGGSGNGVGGVHGTVVDKPSSGCAVASRPVDPAATGEIGLVLVGLMAGSRRRRPRSDE